MHAERMQMSSTIMINIFCSVSCIIVSFGGDDSALRLPLGATLPSFHALIMHIIYDRQRVRPTYSGGVL